MAFPLVFNIGSPDQPDLINLKGIKRAKKLRGTDKWQLWGMITPPEGVMPITVTDDQYAEIALMLDEHMAHKMERVGETPTIRVSVDQ